MTDTPPPPPPEEPTNPTPPTQGQQHPQQPYPQNAYAAPAQPMRPEDEKLWATLIHVGGIFFSFIPSLIGYLVLKDRGPFIRDHTRAALNFQITMAIALVIGYILTIVVIGIFVVLAVYVVVIIFSIIAATRANAGQPYRYPLSIAFIK